jgi:hypothetical protein
MTEFEGFRLDRLNWLLMRGATRNGAPSDFAFTARFLTRNNECRHGRTTKAKRVTRLQRRKNTWSHGLARPQRSTKLGKSTSYRTSLSVLRTRRSRDSARWRRKRSAHFKLVERCLHARNGYRCKLIPRHGNRCDSRKRPCVRWRGIEIVVYSWLKNRGLYIERSVRKGCPCAKRSRKRVAHENPL